jgi:hypothetical protein
MGKRASTLQSCPEHASSMPTPKQSAAANPSMTP